MKKILNIIILTFFLAFNVHGQVQNKSDDTNLLTFIEHIKNLEYDKAYLMLSEEKRKKESEAEFALYFNTLTSFYGKLKNYKLTTQDITEVREHSMLIYEIEFTKTDATLALGIKPNKTNILKIDFYENLIVKRDIIKEFNKVSKVELKHLKKKEYKNLYDSIDMKYLFKTYKDFEDKIKRLEVDKQIKYSQKWHSIMIADNTVFLDITYEINNIGNITFAYEKENKTYNLSYIRFYFSKEIEDAYEANLLTFMDTTSLLKDKNNLTSEDSLFLKEKFDKIEREKKKSELQQILNASETPVLNNDISIGISYDWDQLEKLDQVLIQEASERYLMKLADNDIKGFWELCHSKLKETTPFVAFNEVGMLIGNMITSMDSLEFIDGKKVTYTSAPMTSKFTTGGSLDKSNPTYLQFYTLAGIENQSLSLYKLKNKPLSKTITMKFGLEDSIYKLTSFEINTSSIIDKDANYYINLAKKWESNKSSLPRLIALNMAYKLSYLGKGASTRNMLDLTEKLQLLQKDSELILEIKKWNVNDSIFDVINVDFIETQSDITPNIIYLSKVELGEKSTEEEVKILFKYFREKYPDLVQEFERFMFTAYEEYPAIPTKQYNLFRVIMDINEVQ